MTSSIKALGNRMKLPGTAKKKASKKSKEEDSDDEDYYIGWRESTALGDRVDDMSISGSEEDEEGYHESVEAAYTKSMDIEMEKFEEKYHVRAKAKQSQSLVHSRKFNVGIGVMVMVNAVQIGIEADYACRVDCDASDAILWLVVGSFFCMVFLVEMLMRMFTDGLMGYFADPFNRVDFVLVWLSLLDVWILPLALSGTFVPALSDEESSENQMKILAILRLCRLLRIIKVVRLTQAFRDLWMVITGMLEALKGIGWTVMLLALVLYCFGILFTILIGKAPEGDFDYTTAPGKWTRDDYWGNVPKSMYSLLQVATRDSWNTSLVRPLVFEQTWLIMCFFLFMTVATFSLMNIIVGILCEITEKAGKENMEKVNKMMNLEQERVLVSLRAIFEAADADGSGEVDKQEYNAALKKRHVKEKLRLINIPFEDMHKLFNMLDGDGSGSITIDEFIDGCSRLKGLATSKDLIKVAMEVTTFNHITTEMRDQLTKDNKMALGVLQRLQWMQKEYFVDNPSLKRKKKLSHQRKGPPSNAPLEDRIDAVSNGTDERALLSASPSRGNSRPATRESSIWRMLSIAGDSSEQHFPSRPQSREKVGGSKHRQASRPHSRELLPAGLSNDSSLPPTRPQSREVGLGRTLPSRPQSRENPAVSFADEDELVDPSMELSAEPWAGQQPPGTSFRLPKTSPNATTLI